MRLSRIIRFVAVIQTVLFLTHYFLYQTWTFSSAGESAGALWLKLSLFVLSISFVIATLLAHRYTNPALRAFYRAAAIWLGLLTFLFIAAVGSWAVFAVAALARIPLNFHRLVQGLFGAGLAVGVLGIFNASWTRITRTTIKLANLPVAWRGRKAALISDVHLGHVRNGNFLRRMVSKILDESPDAIFIAGDHEQFGDDSKYLQAVKAAGVRVLNNEKVEADGLQIVGVPYNNATRGEHLASALKSVHLDRDRASVLLVHAPDHPEVAEAAGVSLQLSGHTHLGQFIPWSWFARKIYRQFVYGLSRIGKMQVFTSSGAGTWGPPLRLGSNPEIVVMQFE